MNAFKLARCVQTIGMRCLVTHFDRLMSGRPVPKVAWEIATIEGYDDVATRGRVYCARRISADGQVLDALRMVASATNVSPMVRSMADERIASIERRTA